MTEINFDNGPKEAGRSMRAIRETAGLSSRELADFLRISDVDGLRQMERGKRDITGPIRVHLELIHEGKVNPVDYLTEQVGEGS